MSATVHTSHVLATWDHTNKPTPRGQDWEPRKTASAGFGSVASRPSPVSRTTLVVSVLHLDTQQLMRWEMEAQSLSNIDRWSWRHLLHSQPPWAKWTLQIVERTAFLHQGSLSYYQFVLALHIVCNRRINDQLDGWLHIMMRNTGDGQKQCTDG